LNEGDNEGYALGRLEHKTGKEYTDVTGGFTFGNPKLVDNAGLWVEGNVVSNNLKNYAAHGSWILGYENQWFVGSKVIANLHTQKLDEAHGFVAAKFNDSFAFFLTNCLARKFRVGFWTPNIQYLKRFQAETQFELDEKHQLKGSPTSTVAFTHKLNDDSAFKAKFDISKEVYAHFSFVHKINKNLQITLTDYANPLGFFRNSGKEQYKLGVSLEANL